MLGMVGCDDEGKRAKAYDTRSSQVVPHPSTIRAQPCLSSEIGRDPEFSR